MARARRSGVCPTFLSAINLLDQVNWPQLVMWWLAEGVGPAGLDFDRL